MSKLEKQFAGFRELFAELAVDIEDARSGLASLSLEELAELVFEAKSMLKWVNDLRTELQKTSSLAYKVTGVRWASETNGERIPCRYGYVTPVVKHAVPVPKKDKDPELYKKVMDSMGLTQQAQDNEAVRIHWPGWVEYVSGLTSKGLPLPEGIDMDTAYPVYSCNLRPSKKAKSNE